MLALNHRAPRIAKRSNLRDSYRQDSERTDFKLRRRSIPSGSLSIGKNLSILPHERGDLAVHAKLKSHHDEVTLLGIPPNKKEGAPSFAPLYASAEKYRLFSLLRPASNAFRTALMELNILRSNCPTASTGNRRATR